MNIKVWDDRYTISNDANCYVVKEIKEKKPKDGEESGEEIAAGADGTYEVIIGYPSTVAYAFKIIWERECRSNRCTTFEGWMKHVQRQQEKLDEAIEIMLAICGGHENVQAAMTRVAKYADE